MKKLSKYIIFIFLTFIVVFLLSSIFLYHNQVPHKLIKGLIEKELCKTFDQKVTVETLSGNLFNQIKLTNIRFYNNENFQAGTMLEIGKLVLNYSLLQALGKRNDIIAGTSHMDVYDVKLNILRSKKDLWNILDIIPPPPRVLPPAPLTLTGKIKIHSLSINFIDEKGW